MPVWIQVILGAAALATACGVLWAKVVKPVVRAITLIQQVVPLLDTLVEIFAKEPKLFEVLYQIADQFKTNDGSSLRDCIDRLEAAAALNAAAVQETKAAAELLKVGVEASRQLAIDDRAELRQIRIDQGRAEEQRPKGAS